MIYNKKLNEVNGELTLGNLRTEIELRLGWYLHVSPHLTKSGESILEVYRELYDFFPNPLSDEQLIEMWKEMD